jgi:hypothetical protein
MNTGNRVLWSIIGALLFAAGVVGVLASQVEISNVDRQQPLLTTELIDWWNAHSGLAAGLTIAGGLLAAFLGFLLLRAQLRGRGGAPMRDLAFGARETDASEGIDTGRTKVASSALHHALERDLATDRNVRRAAVRLTGPSEHPELLVRLAVTPDADIARVAGHLEGAVQRFTTTSGVTPDLSDVLVRIPAVAPQRVQ